MSQTTDPARHVTELIDRAKISMLVTTAGDGRYVSRPMAVQESEFDGDLWFFVYDDSDKVAQISADPRVNVAFANDKNSEWVSVAGTASLVHDADKAKELWSAPLKTWFPDGLDTAGLALIKVHADSAEYWESSSSKAVQAIGAVRAATTGDPGKFPSNNEEVPL